MGAPERVATINQKLELFLESVSVVLLCVVAAGVGFLLSVSLLGCCGIGFLALGSTDPFSFGSLVLGGPFYLAGTIVPFIYVFYKLTFPVRQ
jgi:hypothetical protein